MERMWTIAWSGTIIKCQVRCTFRLSNTPSRLFNSIVTIPFLSSIKNWQPLYVKQRCRQEHSCSWISSTIFYYLNRIIEHVHWREPGKKGRKLIQISAKLANSFMSISYKWWVLIGSLKTSILAMSPWVWRF